MIRIHILYRFNCDISPYSQIDTTARFPHPIGIVIGRGCKVGRNTVVFQNVTLGVNVVDGVEYYPVVENDCKIYPNSIVMGNVTIRKGTYIGAGSVITKDTIENGIYHGSSATLFRTRESKTNER